MTADLVAGVLLLAMAAYACGGGTDYGAGFWDLFAGSLDRGKRPRSLVDHAMAPVWEVNNVWLVFVLVVLWTGFPRVFEAVLSTTWVALSFAALGLVLRGAAFAMRKPTLEEGRRRRYGHLFGVASLLTPFFLAAVIGGVASGRVPLGNAAGDRVTSWFNPTSMLFGVLAVVAGAFLAAAFLGYDARRIAPGDLEGYFARRTIGSGLALIVIGAFGLLVLRADAWPLYDGLVSGWGAVLAVVAVCAIGLTIALVARQARRGARLSALAAVAAIVLAWGAVQEPYLLPPSLTIDEAAGDGNTLTWLLIVTGIAVVLVGPALALLYWLDLGDRLTGDEDADLVLTRGVPAPIKPTRGRRRA